MIMGNALWQLIKQSDAISWFVLLVLLVVSIACWTIFLFKLLVFRFKKQHLKKAIHLLNQAQTTQDVQAIANSMQGTLPGYIIKKYLRTMQELQTAGVSDPEVMQNYADQLIDMLVMHEESYLPFIVTSAAVSPLLGLFGTVWGLVHAFIGISERQTADIVAVAPGIAQALTTTLAGLVVAIPALIMFNYLQTQVRTIEQQFFVLVDTLNMRLKYFIK